MRIHLTVLASLFIFGLITASGPPPVAAEPGYRVVNVLADFIDYYEAAKDRDEKQRAALWRTMLETKHQAFFDDAIYRRKKGRERARYKAYCITTFWAQLAPEMEFYRSLSRKLGASVGPMVRSFQEHLPDYKPATDFFLTFSFSFRGKVVGVGGRDVLALGLEFFQGSGAEAEQQIRITMAHELFHLYHFRFFSGGGGLYRQLWTEGLATYASAVVVPGLKRSAYLGFSGTKMNRCHDLLPRLAADLKKNMGDNNRRLRRIYFGAEKNDTQVPPEAGYYVGLLIIEKLAERYRLEELARLDKNSVFKLVASELDRLSRD